MICLEIQASNFSLSTKSPAKTHSRVTSFGNQVIPPKWAVRCCENQLAGCHGMVDFFQSLFNSVVLLDAVIKQTPVPFPYALQPVTTM